MDQLKLGGAGHKLTGKLSRRGFFGCQIEVKATGNINLLLRDWFASLFKNLAKLQTITFFYANNLIYVYRVKILLSVPVMSLFIFCRCRMMTIIGMAVVIISKGQR